MCLFPSDPRAVERYLQHHRELKEKEKRGYLEMLRGHDLEMLKHSFNKTWPSPIFIVFGIIIFILLLISH